MGEEAAFSGDPLLQLSAAELALAGAKPVICMKTALGAFATIVEQGEGAPEHSAGSHYQKFLAIRDEYAATEGGKSRLSAGLPRRAQPGAATAHGPHRPRLDRARGSRRDGRSRQHWLRIDVAAPRLLVLGLRDRCPKRRLAVDLSMGLMRAVTLLAERAARLPAGPSNPGCNAGMSFTALRDAASLAARRERTPILHRAPARDGSGSGRAGAENRRSSA